MRNRAWCAGIFIIAAMAADIGAATGAQEASATRPAAAKPAARAVTMRGVVYEDVNANGVRDDGERGIEGMPVSDGLTILKARADGGFEFAIREKERGSVFVCTPAGWRASKRFFVITDFERYDGGVQPSDIGLVRDPARNTDRFTFIQLTDTHVTESEDTVRTMMDDIDVVNRFPGAVTFVVATGDLVNEGKYVGQLHAYVEATRNARHPIYNVIGNHDYGGDLRSTENYEKVLGPPYYSFDVGPYHFVAKDIVSDKRNAAAHERQMKWIEEDLRINGAGKRVVVFQHFPPTIRDLDWWAEYNAAAVFSGHWHGRRECRYKGILDVNSSTPRFGGIDRSPRGFRIIHVNGDRMRCEWRVGHQQEHVEIVHPPIGGSVGGSDIVVRVLAYDTVINVERVRYHIFDGGAPRAAGTRPVGEGDLWSDGSWSWAGRWRVPEGLGTGPKWIRVEAEGVDGSTWTKEGSFTLDGAPAPAVKAGEDWPFFHNDAGHRGYLEGGPRPPLSLAWATSIGGTIHLSSPVIGGGRVYAASSFDQSLDDCAVVALDLTTGRKLWRAPVDSSVKHSLAVWDGNIMAASQAGTLYCFNAEGYPRWTASLDRGRDNRWELSFPVTDGKAVYAGRSTGFGAYDLATGTSLWSRAGGNDWWPNIYSGPSLGAGVVYQGGPFVRALDPADGKVLWANDKMAVSTVAVVPAVVERGEASDRLYVFHNQKTLRCLDGKTGRELWEASFAKADGSGTAVVPLGDETGTPAIGGDIVCVGGAEVALSGEERSAAMHGFDKATGSMRWRFTVGADLAPSLPYKRGAATITSSPVIVGEVVYFGASDGWFYALDVRDGRLVWKYWFGLPIASTAAVSGNAVVVTTWDGTVYALVAP